MIHALALTSAYVPLAMSTTVPTIAAAMPTADRRLPLRAVAGEFIWCRPSTKQAAAAR